MKTGVKASKPTYSSMRSMSSLKMKKVHPSLHRRQFRKRDAYPTGITQNVKYLLGSKQGTSMLSNSEFIVLLNQSPNDREDLAELLKISKEQQVYITNAQSRYGLIKYGVSLVPFVNRIPENNLIYQMNTTKSSDRNMGFNSHKE